MGKFQDLTGMTFGRLLVIERAENKGKNAAWRCRCKCGNERTVQADHLKSGVTQSCGCLQKERVSEANFEDLTGKVFGRLTVLERAKNKGTRICWHCQCNCGNEVVANGGDLKSGHVQSCGCLRKECASELNKTHGMTDSKIHGTWANIKARCFNPNNRSYKDYGGRGITVYEPWVHDFQAFYEYVSQLEHFGEYGYSLDRIDNNGNYEPCNLRWATRKEQNRNTRRNHLVEYEGEKMTAAEAAEKAGLPARLVHQRIRAGWADKYLFVPNQGQIQKGAPPKK